MQWRIIERAHGLTDFDARTIELDERLRHDPSMLATTWSHELLHASLRYAQLPRATEKVFTGKVEEDIVTAIAPVLSRAMAQLKEIK